MKYLQQNILMRPALLFAFVLTVTFCAAGQGVQQGFDLSNYGVRIEPDKRLIVILAALEMAETKNEAGVAEKLIKTPLSEKGVKFREQLLKDTSTLDGSVRQRISTFVLQYKKRHSKATDAELVAPFISMAHTLGPLPDLAAPARRDELPLNLLDVLDFAILAREFYLRSAIGAKLDEYVKLYQAEADGVLRRSAREMVSELLDYLHTKPELFATETVKVQALKTNSKSKIQKTETRTHERRFIVVPEMLAPRGAINFLNARDDYFVILPPDKDLSLSDVRRAYLHFVIDPLVLNNSKDIPALRTWTRSRLEDVRKTNPAISLDVMLAASRSLAAAVDVRQSEHEVVQIATEQARRKIDTLKTDAEKRAVAAELEKYKQAVSDEAVLRLHEDHEKGLVLTFFFAEKLKEIEDSGFDIAASLGPMLTSFDPVKETDRVAGTVDARNRALAAREDRKKNPGPQATANESPVTAKLREILKTIDAKDYTKAAADLKQLQALAPSDPRIFFNLARVARLEAANTSEADIQIEKLTEAAQALNSVLRVKTPDTDPALLSLTYVALGRINEHFNRNAEAIALYDEAIKLTDVAGGGFNEAKAGKQRLTKQQ